jgi:hypothetical protein
MNKNRVKEQVDYGDYPERMHPSIQQKLEKGETPYSEHPAMPEGEKNFDQIVASKRFKDVVDRFAHYAGTRAPLRGNNPMMSLMQTAMGMVMQINQIEQRNKRYLENLAIDLVKKQMGIPEGKINFIAELVSIGQVGSNRKMKGRGEEYSDEEIQDAFQENAEEAEEHTEDLLAFEDAFEKFDMEKAKRRFMNSLIQGAAKKGHYMFELVRAEIERINPELLNLYGVSQASLDYLYWLYPEQMAMQMAASGEGQAGTEEVDVYTDPPTVRATGISFPVLVHELLKGTYEVLGTHGLPTDPRKSEMVVQSEDTIVAEIWDTRLGPIFWEKFLAAYPDELFDDDKLVIQNYLFSRFSKLQAKEFMNVAKMILSDNPEGKRYIQSMVDEIVKEIKENEYDEAMGDEEDDYGDDDDNDDGDLDDFLSGLGIHTS